MKELPPPSDHPRRPVPPDGRPRIALSSLMRTGGELVIEHDGQDYLLRLTSNGKLILTK